MEKINKHADIPYKSKVYINACENTTDLCLVIPELGVIEFPFSYKPHKVDDTVKFIVEACNNYYRLKEQNEMLLSALSMIEKCDYLSTANEYASEAIKSCQP